MQDRVPTPGQEGRVKITPESGGAAYYAKLEMADNPTQVGDEPIKANLLPDAVATTLGLTGNPQVKDALGKLGGAALRVTTGGVNSLTDTLGNDFPLPFAKIEIGSYTGTGTFGSVNKNSYTFSFAPKVVRILFHYAEGNHQYNGLMDYKIIGGISGTYEVSIENITFTIIVSWSTDGKTVSWYNDTHAANQANTSGNIYYIEARG